MAPFTIYKASAGSGKTFTLSREYIKLLFEQPGGHRRILAVTFTNKATEQMKARIIRDLYQISQGKNQTLTQALCTDLKDTAEGLQHRARQILHELLHDYSHFSILTIDSFFQRIVRSFAREMGLYASYEVEIKPENIISRAIDQMLDSMDDYPELKEWLTDLAVAKMKLGKSWDFHKDLQELGKELFREEFQQNPEATFQHISDKRLLKAFEKALKTIVSDHEAQLGQQGEKGLALMASHGLTVDDFSNKKNGVAGYFQKVAHGTTDPPSASVLAALNNSEKWYTKTSSSKAAILGIFPELNAVLASIVELRAKGGKTYQSAKSVLEKLNLMGALSELALSVRKYTREKNLFLLADTSQLLQKIIADADAPFVYEKIGSFYEHFMIDEFQDTSDTQWSNFRPLITNSMASGHTNWVVGDVKQAIYRFRNTDWRILGNQLEREMPKHSTRTESLQYNWRSDGVLIGFNNAFFARVTQIVAKLFENSGEEEADSETSVALRMSEDLKNAYADSYQYLPQSRKDRENEGQVEVRFLQDTPEESWKRQALSRLPEDIEKLQAMGYQAQDIAILVRKRDEAKQIAQSLLSYKREHPESTAVFDVLSNESLSLSNSSAVAFLLAVMRCLENPENPIHRAFLENEYQQYLKPHIPGGDAFAPQQALRHFASEWSSTPVYELTEILQRQFRLHTLQSELPYLQAFLDTVLQYSRGEPTDLRSFLEWWDECGETRNLIMPEGQNALRLMTIHKAKGLEFKAVLLPLCDWEMNPKTKTLWCRSNQPPLDQMELVAVDYKNDLNESVFQKEYLEEKFMSYMDALNMLYVSFTRAQHTLWITGPVPKESSVPTIGRILHQTMTQPGTVPPTSATQKFISLCEGWDEASMRYRLGNPCTLKEYAKTAENPSLSSLPWGTNHKVRSHMVQQTQWFSDTASDETALHQGRILHELFSRIDRTDSIDPMLGQLEQEGLLTKEQRAGLSLTVQQALRNEQVRQWFDNEHRVKAEASVLLPDGSVCRPDRVLLNGQEAIVVDYKFGVHASPSHHLQVQTYMQHLRSMGYTSVTGYLWYVLLQKVETVAG